MTAKKKVKTKKTPNGAKSGLAAKTPFLKKAHYKNNPNQVNGRPLELTDEITQKFESALKLGAYVETAAAFAGLNKETFYEWLKRGAKGEEPFKKFAGSIERARSEGITASLVQIHKAAEKNWQAAAWKLERTRPHEYGRLQRVEITGAGGAPVQTETFDLSKLSTDELRAYKALRDKMRPKDESAPVASLAAVAAVATEGEGEVGEES